MIGKAFLGFGWKFLLLAAGALIAYLLLTPIIQIDLNFDKSNYFDGVVAFTCGSSIAIFLALIQSKYLERLRDFKDASWDIYLTVFLNTFIIAMLWGLAETQLEVLGVSISTYVTIFATLLCFQILLRLKDLLALYLK